MSAFATGSHLEAIAVTQARTTRQLTEVVPHLFVCDMQTAKRERLLEKHGITHIVSAIPPEAIDDLPPLNGRERIIIAVRDEPDADIRAHFEETTTFIGAAIAAGGNVLVSDGGYPPALV